MTNPNESAFVVDIKHSDGTRSIGEGLTKRELFAALAMQGIWASCPQSPMHGLPEYDIEKVAEFAILSADALISELSKNEKY